MTRWTREPATATDVGRPPGHGSVRGESGTVVSLDDFSQGTPGAFVQSVAPGGATTAVISSTGGAITLGYSLSPGGSLYQEIVYTYLPSTDINAGNIAYVTLLGISDGELTPIEQVHLVYYGNSSSNGLPGDLQMASVEYPDGSGTPMAGESGNWYGWTDDSSGPTAYFRYYTATTMSGGAQIGFAHGLRNALLPVAYSGLASYAAANDGGQVDQVPDSVADTYTCYYFQYDANCRVSKESVYGQTGTWSFTTQLATSSTNSNVWQRKTVTTEPDGATSTVYTNYIGETMLTDLHDPLTGTEAITYNRYDGNGNLLWTAEPSAFQKAGGVHYNQSFTDLIGYSPYGSARPYDGTSQFLKPNAGQFDVNQYYATTGTTNLYNQSNPPSLATSAVGGGVAGSASQRRATGQPGRAGLADLAGLHRVHRRRHEWLFYF